LEKIYKENKLVKKWAREADILLVSDSLKVKFTKLVGKAVNSVNRAPMFILENEKVEHKIEEIKKTIRFKIKKGPWMATAIALDSQTPEEIR
jgi:large subunit ribosomal protein L10Ae